MDYIIIFGRTYVEQILRLEAMFEKLKTAGLKLSPSKCHLFRKQIKHLVHNLRRWHCSRSRSNLPCKGLAHSEDCMQCFVCCTCYKRLIRKGFRQDCLSLAISNTGRYSLPNQENQRFLSTTGMCIRTTKNI